MKYSPNRHYLYPVARPFSDDYPGSLFSTELSVNYSSNDIVVHIEYNINNETIRSYIHSSQVCCVAMLYCRDTIYRKPLLNVSEGDMFSLYETIPMSLLHDVVEVHPAIVACKDIEFFPTITAHSEYGNSPIKIEKGQPLAVDHPWHFEVNPQQRQVHSIFKLVVDTAGDLKADEFDIKINHQERYVDIIADEDTIQRFRSLRSNRNVTFSSLFLSSLITVLSYFKEIDEDQDIMTLEDIPSAGWYRCIYQKLKDHSITLGADDNITEYSIMRAAQLLLTGDSYLRPFGRLFNSVLMDDTEVDNA